MWKKFARVGFRTQRHRGLLSIQRYFLFLQCALIRNRCRRGRCIQRPSVICELAASKFIRLCGTQGVRRGGGEWRCHSRWQLVGKRASHGIESKRKFSAQHTRENARRTKICNPASKYAQELQISKSDHRSFPCADTANTQTYTN